MKNYIYDQERELEIEIRKTQRNKKIDYWPFFKLGALIILTSFFSYLTASYPLERKRIESSGLWGETWTCKNPNCGYENYVGINHCGICGKARYKDGRE